MNLKTWKIISIIGIFLLSSLAHFIYNWFPSLFTSLFFPINESIWEHNKIIFFSFLSFTLIEKIYYKNRKNVFFSGLISAITCSIIVMLIFTPIYLYILKTKDNIIITFTIYIIAISISEYISYKLLHKKYCKKLETLAIFLWFIPFIINGILTYYPLKLPIFYDYQKNIFGIKNFIN